MQKKILITGAGGYIGSVAAYLFLQRGYQVVAVDNYSTGYRQPLELLQEKFGKDKLQFLGHQVSAK
jgi:nucleoside-diphosphate-sugar epimerase